jgi:hypothetical protein
MDATIAQGVPHDLEGCRRKRPAGRELRQPDVDLAGRGEPSVAREGDDTPARQSMSIYRRHDRLGKREDRLEGGAKGRQERVRIRGSPVGQPPEVNTARECRTRPGDDDRSGWIFHEPIKRGANRAHEFQVERLHRAMRQAQHGDVVHVAAFDHDGRRNTHRLGTSASSSPQVRYRSVPCGVL